MDRVTGLSLLLLAALLEAGGDALVRVGIRTPVGFTRPLAFSAGALMLFAYGCLINATRWDFGRLIGIYIVFFFLVAQVIAWLTFGELPSRGMWLGGALVVLGGAIMAMSAN
jgi:drug/metabolite transporter superfamily protein YnfA